MPQQRTGQPPGTATYADVDVSRADVWALLLPQQQRLRAIAIRSGCPAEQARDLVHDTFLRVLDHRTLDPQRLAGLLATVTRNLAVDHHRREHTQQRLGQHLGLLPHPSPSPESDTCDAAEARWLQQQLHLLPARERQVLLARSRGQTPTQIAHDLHVTVKAVELLTRRGRLHIVRILAKHAC